MHVSQPTCRRRRRHHQGSDAESLFGEFTKTWAYVQYVYVIGYAILLTFDVKSIIFITSYAKGFVAAEFVLQPGKKNISDIMVIVNKLRRFAELDLLA